MGARQIFAAGTVAVIVFIITLLGLVAFALQIGTFSPKAEATSETLTILETLEIELVNLTNAERAKQGLPELQVGSNLTNLARQRSGDMITDGYFKHRHPNSAEDAYLQLLRDFGITYASAGENIARNNYPWEESAQVAIRGLMNSPGHRINVLDPKFNEIGIGVAIDPNGMVYFTQVFVGNNLIQPQRQPN